MLQQVLFKDHRSYKSASENDDVFAFGPEYSVKPSSKACCDPRIISFRPSKQTAERRKVMQIVAGAIHTIFVLSGTSDKQPNVFSCGHNSSYQLGNCDDMLAVLEQPKIIQALQGHLITCVAAGGTHTVSCSGYYFFFESAHSQVADSGLVFSWGRLGVMH